MTEKDLMNLSEEFRYDALRMSVDARQCLKPVSDAAIGSFLPAELIPLLEYQTYQKGEIIIHEKYTIDRYLMVMLSGACACSYKGKLIKYQLPGDIIGDIRLAQHDATVKPSATITAYTDSIILAKLKLNSEICNLLWNDIPFMNRLSELLAKSIIASNIYYSLDNKTKSLAAYILIQSEGVDETQWNPNKADVKRDLNLADHSQLNKLIDGLIEIGGLTDITEGKKGRGRRVSTYLVHTEVLEEIINHVDYMMLKNRYASFL